ncbi:hypothetical protein DUNSADRAFT_16385, partial [Dunaliella salina]
PSKRGPDSAPHDSDAAAKKQRLESHAAAGDAAGDEELGSPDSDPFKKAMIAPGCTITSTCCIVEKTFA